MRKVRMLDRIQSQLRGEIEATPIAKLIGFELTDISEGRAVVELQTGSQHANPMGTLHGGILCDIADAAMGLAYASNLAEGETFTTLELKINFLKPVGMRLLRRRPRCSSKAAPSAASGTKRER